MRELLEHADRVLIGGHRGSACLYPENSIEAMEHGLLSGADYLEIDLSRYRSGETDRFARIRSRAYAGQAAGELSGPLHL